MADRTKAIIEQAVGRKLCEDALRKIELGHSTFDEELKTLQAAKKVKGELRRDWTLAERLLKKARAEREQAPVTEPPSDESAAL